MQVIAILVPHKTFFTLFVSLAITSVIACSNDLSEEQSEQVDEALRDSLTSTTESWGVDMEIIEDGEKKVRLLGERAETFTTSDLNETRITGPITIHVFDSTGAIKTRIYSGRALYQPDESVFELYDDVRVHTRDKRQLQSEYLEWHQDQNTINTPKFVIILTPTDSIAGTGFEGDTDLVDYTIKEPKGKVTLD